MRNSCLVIAFLATLLISGYQISANKQQPTKQQSTFIVLESSERVASNVPFITALAAAPSKDNEQLYSLRSNTGDTIIYDHERELAKSIPSLTQRPETLAVGQRGQIYLVDSESRVRILKPTGELLNTFRVPFATSLAELSDGNIVIASPMNGKLLHLYSPTGRLLRSFGEMRLFDSRNHAQNHFLNRGKVLVGSSDEIFYFFKYAPVPLALKFSKKGRLLTEFTVEGAAVDIQLEMAHQFLMTKDSNTVGGFTVITSAGIDPATGHLWVSMNGSSESGVIYEYTPNGQKLQEYALVAKSSSPEIITGVKDVIAKNQSMYVLTWEGQVYRFNIGDSSMPKLSTTKQAEQYGKQQFVSFNRRQPLAPILRSSTMRPAVLQLPCPPEQPFTCTVNCPLNSIPVTQDCAAEIKKRLAQGDRIISNSCTINSTGNGSCSATATSCNTTSGTRVTYSVTLNCNAPSGGGGECDFQVCDTGLHWDSSQCCCADSGGTCFSPILIDVWGNGFNLTDASGGVDFDLNANGTAERLSWTSANSDDAFLVLDRNNNGTIDNGTELFGNSTPQPPSPTPNGFLALAEFDKPENGGNNDGQIDSNDAIFSSLRLWQDSNHNGISEAGELHTLPALRLRSIELDYKESKRTDQYGNRFRYRAKVKDEHGAQLGRWAWDVFLVPSY